MMSTNYVINVFKAYDEDKDGCLSKSEALNAALEFGIDKKDLRKIVKAMKLEDESRIPVARLTEDIKCFCIMKFKKDPYLEMFKRIDLDGSGQLSFAEVKLVVEAFGLAAEEGIIQNLFHKADKNRDGYIDEKEYVNFMFEVRENVVM